MLAWALGAYAVTAPSNRLLLAHMLQRRRLRIVRTEWHRARAAQERSRMDTRKWLLALTLIVAGCATMGGYQPTVDPYNDPHAARIPSDEAECRELALHASGGTPEKTAIGAAVGGVLGAAAGAAIGAASGAPGAGAAIGAASGGLGGGAYEGFSAEEKFKHAFQACMRERGHHVLD